ncbi:ion channel pore / TrkA domain protein [Halobacterium hubeiense]|jgi:voltage-gated potassium channel|uniref:Ion channel pore / TrkA domain protein n=2 Tax=Halobacterium TaxID=2239 RepID=A0A0U5AHI0_9EURY|nr:NAD-binding protein [Halobacterium hubeiense]CQH60385.1 ion channel pore / TrkA domain protein [Halobacterium hubeiense]
MDVPGAKRVTGRVAVALTLAVAALSVGVGILGIVDPTANFGPVAQYIPPAISQTAGFTGSLTGFLMVMSAFGLRRGLRVAWYSTLVLLPITAGQGLVQATPYSVPLVVLSVVAFPVLAVARSRFDEPISLSTSQLAAGGALAGVQAYGTIGTWALRGERGFTGVNTMLDAFYYTLVTSSTVGYGDVTPVTQEARLFSLSVLVLGTASFAVALGALLGPALEARFASALGRMTQSDLESLDGHVVVAGYGDLTEPILTELAASGRQFLVVARGGTDTSELRDRDIDVLAGDPTDEKTLDRAGIERARAVVTATNDDGEDALAILTVRETYPDVRVVAAATEQENEPKLRRAGADTVISPAVIGGRLLARSALGDEHAEEEAADLE